MTLFPHQQIGADWLRGRSRAYLADDMGLGKSRTILSAIPFGNTIGIVCPAIVVPHWYSEARAVGHDPAKLSAFSYQGIIQDARSGQIRRDTLAVCDTLVLDEAHFLANPDAKRTKVVLGLHGLARHHAHVLAASGTPMARHPGNLYPILRALAPHLVAEYPTYTDWLNEFCYYEFRSIPGQRFGKPKLHVFGAKSPMMLNRILTQPYDEHPAFMLRRTEKDAALDLPDIWWQWKRVGVDTSMVSYAISQMDEATRDMLKHVPERLADSPQATALRHALGIAKGAALAGPLAEEWSLSGEAVVCVAHHVAVLDLFAKAMTAEGVTYVRVDGRTPHVERAQAIALFQNGGAQIFLGSIGAMQTGITLTRSAHIVIVEPGWTGDANMQVVKRIHRIGQAQTCRAELLIAAGTIEEAVMQQVEAEIAMAEAVVDGGARPMRATLDEKIP